jgi:tripartite-type tricarboxylate transporter receptor subunit TctC
MHTALRTPITRSAISLCALVLLAAEHLPSALAQTYPAKPVRSVAPYSPGSGPDAVMRILSDKLSRSWGQQLVIDNKPGANGFIAIADAKRAAHGPGTAPVQAVAL